MNFTRIPKRKSFETKLPEEVVWRRKDGFSDGVSENKRPWYQIINDYQILSNNQQKTVKRVETSVVKPKQHFAR